MMPQISQKADRLVRELHEIEDLREKVSSDTTSSYVTMDPMLSVGVFFRQCYRILQAYVS